MARILVRIESAEEGKEFQKFIFARVWRWNENGIKEAKARFFMPSIIEVDDE